MRTDIRQGRLVDPGIGNLLTRPIPHSATTGTETAMMGAMRILAVSGSLQARSSNRAILRTARRVSGPDVEVVDSISVGDVPPFNPDVERVGPAPDAVRVLREQVATADGVLFASPEYAHSLPGSLKNALDWLVGSGELYGKPVAVLCGSPRPSGGVLGREALERTLRAQGATVVVSATVGIAAPDKGADELHDEASVEAVGGAVRALATP
ncbi:MAG: NAD(P)H-dependent oxidoreductase [Actinomycetota bacterium]|nr:NAD(P)H-dependent oxidoreductase [Actinomycetota bacterium]